MMALQLNGAPHRLPLGSRLDQLIASLDLAQQAIAVAVNRRIIARSLWSTHLLQDGDEVEVVRAIGGG